MPGFRGRKIVEQHDLPFCGYYLPNGPVGKLLLPAPGFIQLGSKCDALNASFADDLKRQANRILGQFTRKDFDDYRYTRLDEFSKCCDALKTYKANRKGYVRDEVIQTDVNNYMFIRSQNERDRANDFFSTHSYLISADHVLGD